MISQVSFCRSSYCLFPFIIQIHGPRNLAGNRSEYFFFLHNLYVLRKKLFDVFFIVILLTVRRLISCKIKTKIWRIRKRINESQPAKEKEKVPIHSKRDIKI